MNECAHAHEEKGGITSELRPQLVDLTNTPGSEAEVSAR